jgi:citrate lyase subunit beta/citryl-CoA lyase
MKKLRRTMMFCPASNPKMLFTAQIYNPDCIIFDLEDAIAYAEKDSARDLLCEALKAVDYGNIEVFARINPLYTPFGETDVRELVKAGLKNIRLPMCESCADVRALEILIEEVEKENGIEIGTVKIQCAIETPKGIENAYEIAKSSSRVIAISIGAEDFTRSLGTDRTKAGRELFYARTRVVIAASAAGVDSIDTVWADVADMEGFTAEVKDAKNLGFSGKSCVHPAQVKEVHRIYTPTKDETSSALEIICAAKEAEKMNLGVITVNGKMVDFPIIQKAERIVALAKGAGVYKEEE